MAFLGLELGASAFNTALPLKRDLLLVFLQPPMKAIEPERIKIPGILSIGINGEQSLSSQWQRSILLFPQRTLGFHFFLTLDLLQGWPNWNHHSLSKVACLNT